MIGQFFSISFERPAFLWLLLALPAMIALSWRAIASLDPLQRYLVLITRCVVVALLVLGLAGIEHVRTNKNLTVLFLLDRSNSVPKEMFAEQEQYVHDVTRDMPADDRVGVLTFDGQSYVEQLPMRGGIFFETLPDTVLPDQTDMAGAVRMAMALFPHDTAKRVVIVSDGNNNVGDVLAEVRAASSNGIGVDVLPLYYLHDREVYVEKLVVPPTAEDGDMVPLRAIITSQRPVSGTISLTRNGEPMELPDELARRRLAAGQNLVAIKVPVHGSRPHRFELTFHPDRDSADTLVENNKATGYTFVGGNEKVLLLSTAVEDDAQLIRALRREKIDVDAVRIEDAEGLNLLGFLDYACVILSNVGAGWFTDRQQQELATYVEDMSGGLIMTGGDEAFGAGGWIGTPIEKIMPVDFEIKHRQVIPRGALVIVMHSCEMPRGNYWGKRVAAKTVDTISSRDYFGLLSYSHMQGIVWEIPLQVAINKGGMKQAIQKMSNGDMPDFKQTMDMAVDALMELPDAAQRHIIIISDGDASPPSASTISYMKKNKITCSTVGIGYGSHVTEAPLRRIASQTGGRFYAGKNPKKLPQIFVKESKVIRRPLIIEQPFSPHLHYAMSELWVGFGMDAGIPTLGGMVMTSPKPSGLIEMPLVRRTAEGDDPLLAHWQVGLGRAVAFTSGYWPHWGEQWTDWPRFGKLWAQIVRWTMSRGRRGNFDISTRLEGNRGRIVVDALDEDSNYMNFLNLQASIAKPQGADPERINLTQVGPGRYEATFPVDQTGQYVANITRIEDGQATSVTHSGLAVPYSPEYRELRANEPLLREIVEVSGGRWLEMDPETDDTFRHDLPPTRSHQPVWEWVIAWLLLPMFLFDVAARRLASTVALSIVVEILIDVFFLFGLGIAYLRPPLLFAALPGVLIFGELIGWSIRYRAIRPTIEFFTHSVVALGGAGQASASSLRQLKGTRRRVQEDRTAKGTGERLTRLKRRGRSTRAKPAARYDVGDEQGGGSPPGDIREALGGATTGQDQEKPPEKPEPGAARPPKISDDFTSRLLEARKRARKQMEDGKEDGSED